MAVINVVLTTCAASFPGCPCVSSDPHTLPAVTKSRDILMHMQQNVMPITTRRPWTPLFHRAINVPIIALLSFPSQHCLSVLFFSDEYLFAFPLAFQVAQHCFYVRGALFWASYFKNDALLPVICFKRNRSTQA